MATAVQADEAIRRGGLRVTTQRIRVLEALMAVEGDVSAQSLHQRMQVDHPSIGLATVYRTLAALADAGIVDAMQHGHGTCWRYCSPGHHHHLTCRQCHRVVELHDCAVGAWADSIANQHGFADVRHVVELSGTCEACRS